MSQEVNYDSIRIDIDEGIRIVEEDDSGGESVQDGVEYVMSNQETLAQKAAVLDVVVDHHGFDKEEYAMRNCGDAETFDELVEGAAVNALHEIMAHAAGGLMKEGSDGDGDNDK